MRERAASFLGLSLLAALAFVLSGEGVARADAQAQGQAHSRKASRLAGANKCRAAIPEYTKALRLLKDPVLLFNRAECYRRLNDARHAVADYRRFLVELPAAPNRAQVEAHIAALDPAAAPKGPAVAAKEPSGGLVMPGTALPPPTPKGSPSSTGPGSAGDRLAPIDSDITFATPSPAPTAAEPPVAMAAPPATGGLKPTMGTPEIVFVDPEPMVPTPDTGTASSGLTGQWWFWTTLAVVAVGGGVAGYLLLSPNKTEIPDSGLGNFRF